MGTAAFCRDGSEKCRIWRHCDGLFDRVTKPREVDGKTVKGINFFEPSDSALLHALQNSGCRLLDIGVIKEVAGTDGYILSVAALATFRRKNPVLS